MILVGMAVQIREAGSNDSEKVAEGLVVNLIAIQ